MFTSPELQKIWETMSPAEQQEVESALASLPADMRAEAESIIAKAVVDAQKLVNQLVYQGKTYQPRAPYRLWEHGQPIVGGG